METECTVEVIEDLDFDFETPCEHSQHETLHEDEPARYYLLSSCPYCSFHKEYFICHSGYTLPRSIRCHVCEAKCVSKSEFWTILYTLGE